MAKAHLRFRDILLSIICVVFTIEACAPAASIGNSSVFWWLTLFVTFLMPYGLVCAELGTAYAEEGAGVYEWVRNALGRRWATREAWYYWVNYTTWLASVTLLFPQTIGALLGCELPLWASLAIELAFIWFVVYASSQEILSVSWIINGAAVLKVLMAVGIGALGIWFGINHGFANPLTPESLLPDLADSSAFSCLSIIIYNFMGVEVVTTFVGSMENPNRDMPKAIIEAGLAIVAIYLLLSLGISTAIPSSDISFSSGITDAVAVMAGPGTLPFTLVSLGFLVALFANMMSWSQGVSSVTNQAAKEGNLPHVFAIESPKKKLQVGSTVMNGVMASALVLAEPLFEALGIEIFWAVFSLDVVFTLAAYLPMFPAFLRLRRNDPDHPRPFRCPGGPVLTQVMCWVPVAELLVTIAMTVIPLNGSEAELNKVPLLVGTLVIIAVGEFMPRLLRNRGGGAAADVR